MEQVFGEGSCYDLSIRPWGGISLEQKLRELDEALRQVPLPEREA